MILLRDHLDICQKKLVINEKVNSVYSYSCMYMSRSVQFVIIYRPEDVEITGVEKLDVTNNVSIKIVQLSHIHYTIIQINAGWLSLIVIGFTSSDCFVIPYYSCV